MLAQELALKIPERIVTLCLVVTTPGGRPWENFLTVPTVSMLSPCSKYTHLLNAIVLVGRNENYSFVSHAIPD